MGKLFLVEYNQHPFYEYYHCSLCRTRVAFLEDYILTMPTSTEGIYNKVFNVEVPDDERYHEQVDGNTRADTYCVGCGILLGWKLITVPQPCMYLKEGRFLMILDKLIYWNINYEDQFDDEQHGGANIEQVPNEQDGGANEQGPNDQDGGANEEQVLNEQDGGANEEQVHNEDVHQLAEGIDNIDLNPDL